MAEVVVSIRKIASLISRESFTLTLFQPFSVRMYFLLLCICMFFGGFYGEYVKVLYYESGKSYQHGGKVDRILKRPQVRQILRQNKKLINLAIL